MADDDCDDVQIERVTREQAVQLARAEAKRSYSEREDVISYVAYIAEMHAFCRCEFVVHDGAWIKRYRLLTPAEWFPDEAIRDETILSLAESGNMVSAIRLYRARHGVGLKEGLVGVQRLLGEGHA